MPPIFTDRCALARRRSSPARRTAAADCSVSQNACTEMRGAAAIWSFASRGGGGGPSDACSIFFFLSLILFAYVAELGLVGFGISGRRRRALAILLEPFGSPHRIGRRLGPRLHQVGRVVDHGREVALGRAAEIVILLVLVIERVVEVWPNIVRPCAAGTGGRRDFGVAQPDRRQLLRIRRAILMRGDAA